MGHHPVVTHREVWRRRNVAAETSVYWALDFAGEVLYVGVARDVDVRLSQHRREKPWWDEQVVGVRSLRLSDRAAAQALEQAELDRLRPPGNLRLPGYLRATTEV